VCDINIKYTATAIAYKGATIVAIFHLLASSPLHRSSPKTTRNNFFNGFVATGPRNLQFMIEYIKHSKAYKLQNRHISSRWGPGHTTQFL